MNDLYLIFIAGFLGSAHCIGMCGAFVLAISSTRSRAKGMAHQGLYFAGKTATYSILGAFAGAFGSIFTSYNLVQNILSIFAGVLMLLIGLGLIGVLSRIEGFGKLASIPGYRHAMSYFMKERSAKGTFGLGLLNGLLPCGMVYGLLVKAATTGTIYMGAATMFVFGLATIPALFTVGVAGHLIQPVWRTRLNYASGVIVIILGLITVLRATPAMDMMMGMEGHEGHSMEMKMPAETETSAETPSPHDPATGHHTH